MNVDGGFIVISQGSYTHTHIRSTYVQIQQYIHTHARTLSHTQLV